jgi:hypothetical protein
MGAYLSAVQSACYGAVWAHRRHGRAHGGPPPNNGNRGRWCASANLIQETNVPAGSLLPSHARLQPVSAGCARETHGLRPRFVSMFACLPAGALDDACATAAARRSPGPRTPIPTACWSLLVGWTEPAGRAPGPRHVLTPTPDTDRPAAAAATPPPQRPEINLPRRQPATTGYCHPAILHPAPDVGPRSRSIGDPLALVSPPRLPTGSEDAP